MFKKIKSFFSSENSCVEDEFYNLTTNEAFKDLDKEGAKLILMEPRAYSESQQIADHLKNRHTVVVNLKRVTADQAKRIMDFLSGTIYAIGGNLQKVGGGIFLCTPKNMSVSGQITEEDKKEKAHDNSDIKVEI